MPGEIVGLLVRKDLIKNQDFPVASKDQFHIQCCHPLHGERHKTKGSSCCQDKNKNLLVAAAVSVLAENRKERVKALVEAGADAIVFDNRPNLAVIVLDAVRSLQL